MASENIVLFGFRLNLREGKLSPDPDKVRKIKELEPPQDRTGLRRFLGSVLYFSELIPGIAEDLAALQEYLKIANDFNWDSAAQKAFDKVKNALSDDNFILLPDYDQCFSI